MTIPNVYALNSLPMLLAARDLAELRSLISIAVRQWVRSYRTVDVDDIQGFISHILDEKAQRDEEARRYESDLNAQRQNFEMAVALASEEARAMMRAVLAKYDAREERAT